MEASGTQQQQQQLKEKEQRVHRPYAFEKMEGLVREMQDPENGVPVRSQKLFLTSIPSAFMGYDLIEWLMERLNVEESVEAVHIANQLCQYGYFFPVNDSRTLTVKDDSSLYRFQTPYYWPWQHRTPDNVEYAIYLAKRTLRNKQRHGLEDYELEALNSLKRNLQNKWDIILLQAEEQLKLAKDRKKGDKIVSDSQERAFWRVYRPPPGCTSSLEVVPIPTRARPGLHRAPPRKRTLNDLNREVELLRNSLTRTRIKVSVAIENLKTHFETYMEYDPMISQPQPSNPWITDDQLFWQFNSPLVEVPTEKRVKRWGLSMEELMSDPTGLQEFTSYLRKEYSHENIRFWMAVKELRHSTQGQISEKVTEIFKEFLEAGAPCEINIDGKTMEKVHQEMKSPTRFTFDSAAEHVYTLLLKKDCYPRFIRSDLYRNLLATGIQPSQKKRFFGFGGQAKKKVSSITTPMPGSLQQQHSGVASAARRRGSDRSLSGSAHELAVCGVRDTSVTHRVPHSHSQSNLTDIPYRSFTKDAGIADNPGRADDVCPWDLAPSSSNQAAGSLDGAKPSSSSSGPLPILEHRSSRKNSSQLDSSCSSSSDTSFAIAEVSERLKRSCPPASIQRNYSMGSGSVSRTKLAETSRASISSCTFASPQQSFEFGLTPEEQQQIPTQTPGKTVAKAPLISISAIVGELPEETTAEVEKEQKDDGEETSSDCALMSEPVTQAQSLPDVGDDTEARNLPAETSRPQQPQQQSSQEQKDNNVNEVCPWEDEDCKVDGPYVKTYATLGYL